MPYAETHYRVLRDQKHRAIAGLSMGGAHTLNIAIPHPDEFAYVGVFSSGIFGIVPLGGPGSAPAAGPTWEQQHAWRNWIMPPEEDWKLFWFATGKDDFLLTPPKPPWSCSRSMATSRIPRKRRSSHLDQLARVPERVRAAIVSITYSAYSDTIQVYVSRTGAHRHRLARSQAAGRMVRAEAGFSHQLHLWRQLFRACQQRHYDRVHPFGGRSRAATDERSRHSSPGH